MIMRIMLGAALFFAVVVLVSGAYSSYRGQKEMADARKHAESLYEKDRQALLNKKEKS